MPKLNTAYFMTTSGRIPRSEFWIYFQLPIFVVSIVLTLIASVIGSGAIAVILTFAIYAVSIFLTVAGGIRRAHDRDKSGWWVLLYFIPIVNLWPFIEFGFLKGTPGDNRFGPDPLGGVV